MQPFELFRPGSLEDALAMLADRPDARPLAGGTALVVLMKQGLFRPDCLIDLKRIPGARGVTWDPSEGLRVGALTTIRELEQDPVVRSRYPALAEACHVVANIRIRNLATLGGNLAHADYQSDPPAMLVALDAGVRVRSADGAREEPLERFLVSGYQTTLAPGELLTEILVPPPNGEPRTRYLKFTTRSAEDRPCVGVAVRLGLDGETCTDLRVVVGAVSSVPVRVTDAEELAHGERLDESLADELGARAAAAVEPIGDVRGSAEYKRRVVHVLVRRMILDALAEATP